jgi:hypothetical protein
MLKAQGAEVNQVVATVSLPPPPRWLELLGGICPKGDFVNSSWVQSSIVATTFGFQVCVVLIAIFGS